MSASQIYWGGDTVRNGRTRQLKANSFAELVKKLKPKKVPISREEFNRLPKKQRLRHKDGRWLSPCTYSEGTETRSKKAAEGIALLCLDLDQIPEGPERKQYKDYATQTFERGDLEEALWPYNFVAYETASSQPDRRAVRIIVEAKDIDLGEYADAVFTLASKILGIEIAKWKGADESASYTQAMFFPVLFKGDTEPPVFASITHGEAFLDLDINWDEESEKEPTSLDLPEPKTRKRDDEGWVDDETARNVLRHLESKLGRPEYGQWRNLASAVFEGVGRERGITLLKEFFPEVPDDTVSYEQLADSLREYIPWETLRSFGVDPMPNGLKRPSSHTFPPIISGDCLMTSHPEPPPEVIKGVIGQGEKLMLAGPSKAGKTFAQLALACAVANGTEWFSRKCVEGNVLFINFEVGEARMSERLRHFEGVEKVDFLNLRGQVVDWYNLRSFLVEQQKRYSLIILDPIYKMLADREENSNSDISRLLHEVERVAEAMGAVVSFSHHFSKGKKATVSQIDRASGAGVWARDPDAIMTLSEHDLSNCFVLEASLRNYASPLPSVWSFEFPHFQPVPEADPSALKGRNRKDKKGSAQTVLSILAQAGGSMGKKELVQALCGELDVGDRTARRRINEAEPLLKLENGVYSLTGSEESDWDLGDY